MLRVLVPSGPRALDSCPHAASPPTLLHLLRSSCPMPAYPRATPSRLPPPLHICTGASLRFALLHFMSRHLKRCLRFAAVHHASRSPRDSVASGRQLRETHVQERAAFGGEDAGVLGWGLGRAAQSRGDMLAWGNCCEANAAEPRGGTSRGHEGRRARGLEAQMRGSEAQWIRRAYLELKGKPETGKGAGV